MTSRTEYIDRLRKLADLLEAEPDLILPYKIGKLEVVFYPTGATETAQTAKLLPTSWAKNDPNASSYDADYYKLTGEWAGVILTIIEDRYAVCKRVQVGAEKVVHAAVKAKPQMVEERPVYEYQCEPLLAKAVA